MVYHLFIEISFKTQSGWTRVIERKEMRRESEFILGGVNIPQALKAYDLR
jgi:hypothetical protein